MVTIRIVPAFVRRQLGRHGRTIRSGSIIFVHEVILNMVTWQEIHGHYSSFDRRIPPWECYINEENRPYYPDAPLNFRLAKDIEIRIRRVNSEEFLEGSRRNGKCFRR
jgi:hypothetical protein